MSLYTFEAFFTFLKLSKLYNLWSITQKQVRKKPSIFCTNKITIIRKVQNSVERLWHPNVKIGSFKKTQRIKCEYERKYTFKAKQITICSEIELHWHFHPVYFSTIRPGMSEPKCQPLPHLSNFHYSASITLHSPSESCLSSPLFTSATAEKCKGTNERRERQTKFTAAKNTFLLRKVSAVKAHVTGFWKKKEFRNSGHASSKNETFWEKVGGKSVQDRYECCQ